MTPGGAPVVIIARVLALTFLPLGDRQALHLMLQVPPYVSQHLQPVTIDIFTAKRDTLRAEMPFDSQGLTIELDAVFKDKYIVWQACYAEVQVSYDSIACLPACLFVTAVLLIYFGQACLESKAACIVRNRKHWCSSPLHLRMWGEIRPLIHHKESLRFPADRPSGGSLIMQDQGETLQLRLFFRAMPSQAALALRVGHTAVFAGVLPPPASAAHADGSVRSSNAHQQSIATWHEVACSAALCKIGTFCLPD